MLGAGDAEKVSDRPRGLSKLCSGWDRAWGSHGAGPPAASASHLLLQPHLAGPRCTRSGGCEKADEPQQGRVCGRPLTLPGTVDAVSHTRQRNPTCCSFTKNP